MNEVRRNHIGTGPLSSLCEAENQFLLHVVDKTVSITCIHALKVSHDKCQTKSLKDTTITTLIIFF